MKPTASFMEEYRNWLIWSVVLHVVVAFAFSLSAISLPRQIPQQVSVKATLVDETKLKSVKDAKAAEQRKAEQQRKAKAEAEAKARAQREKQAAERRAEQERKAKVEREKQAKAEAERKVKLEQERKAKAEAEQRAKQEAETKAKAEAERKAQAEAEAKARAEAERKARAEAEAKAKAEAEAAAAARREAELLEAMEAEERLLAARNSGELAQYIALIRDKVERNWAAPAGGKAAIKCEVNVSQIPGGEVVSVRIGRCNADPAIVRSIEAAVYKSSPLPLPTNPALFERNLKFNFEPDL